MGVCVCVCEGQILYLCLYSPKYGVRALSLHEGEPGHHFQVSSFFCFCYHQYMFAFSALTLLVGWQEGHLACKKTEQWGAGMVICLERGADLHMAQLMPLPLTSVKSRFVLPFSYRLTGVVPEKGLLNRCVCVCVLSSI